MNDSLSSGVAGRANTAQAASEDDRALLELAAEAAGIDHISAHADGFIYAHNEVCENPVRWNPLTDDGDALRLAVKLRLLVDINTYRCKATDGHITEQNEEFRDHATDAAAATRRAIVRAAAAIGAAK